MRRREFIAGIVGSATAWPLAASAEPLGKLPSIGFLSVVVRERNQQVIAAFVDSLREQGYVEGREFTFVYGSADGQLDHDALVRLINALYLIFKFAILLRQSFNHDTYTPFETHST